jgi:NADP-dependent aldehyde dehydrogenase
MTLTTTDPRTGTTRETGIDPTTRDGVGAIVARAAAAAPAWAATPREDRARVLDALAAALETDRDALVAAAMAETGLAEARLAGEVARSAFQLRLFAEAIREGGYLEAAIDHAGPTPLGPAPDVRRMLVPLGPVAVFGSSNFPFAFSVAGGDTASALAAGCPVVIKAHGSHPVTSARTFEVLSAAATAAGAPAGLLGIVFGQAAGGVLVTEPGIRAVGFTGSTATAETLLELMGSRERPIPFYGELSSLNPLIVTPRAAAARGPEIARGLHASVTGSGGQLCTKPGIAFVPRSASALLDELAALIGATPAATLLNHRIHDAFEPVLDRIAGDGGAAVHSRGEAPVEGFSVAPALLVIDARDLTPAATEEAFGPLVVVALYDSPDDIVRGLDAIPDSLTASLHSEPAEAELRAELVAATAERAGRLVFDGFPTGVRVSWAQHHGGPWPATNTVHTSVGVTAIRRFLRPLAWQDAPADVLPEELRDGVSSVPRRVDGRLELPA